MPKFLEVSNKAAARTAIAASDYVGAVRPEIAANGSDDDWEVIQAALDTGSDVVLSGPVGGTSTVDVKTSATLVMATRGQRLTTVNCRIAPAFVGDAVRITESGQHVNVEITSTLQPGSGDFEEIAAIRIGLSDCSENPKNASVAGSRVSGAWKGNGIIWEHGAHINFAHFSVELGVTFDGIRATNNCGDNNEGNFASTRVSNCGRYGYWIQNNSGDSNKSSRAHVFSNAKAFGCAKNFVIETRHNVGSVYSELGTDPDEFTSTSLANNIQYAETNTSYANVVDAGTGNQISGRNSFNRWDTRNLRARKLFINNLLSGYWEFTQPSAYNFTDEITGSNTAMNVTHTSSGTGGRTDTFDRLATTGTFTAATSKVSDSAYVGVIELSQTANYTFLDQITGTNNNVTCAHNSLGAGVRTDTFQNLVATDQLKLGNNPVVSKVAVPATAGSTGVAGTIAFDGSHIYLCVATDTWVRAAVATW